MKFESTKSMIRYLPPNGTAGFERARVSGSSRVPLPPAMTNARTWLRIAAISPPVRHGRYAPAGPADASPLRNLPSLNQLAAHRHDRRRDLLGVHHRAGRGAGRGDRTGPG